jgi:hypothetical protein
MGDSITESTVINPEFLKALYKQSELAVKPRLKCLFVLDPTLNQIL